MNEAEDYNDTNPDREMIGELKSLFSVTSGDTLISRTYGRLRRSGKSPKEAAEEITRLVNDSPYEQEGESEIPIDYDRRQKLAEKLGYQWELEHPEEYLYHGADEESSKGIIEEGLKKNSYQSSGEELEIFLFEGTQDLHESASDADFHGFGWRGGKFRVRRSDLEAIGFEIKSFPFGQNTAISAIRTDAVIPPSILERWDESVQMWLPVVDVKAP